MYPKPSMIKKLVFTETFKRWREFPFNTSVLRFRRSITLCTECCDSFPALWCDEWTSVVMKTIFVKHAVLPACHWLAKVCHVCAVVTSSNKFMCSDMVGWRSPRGCFPSDRPRLSVELITKWSEDRSLFMRAAALVSASHIADHAALFWTRDWDVTLGSVWLAYGWNEYVSYVCNLGTWSEVAGFVRQMERRGVRCLYTGTWDLRFANWPFKITTFYSPYG